MKYLEMLRARRAALIAQRDAALKVLDDVADAAEQRNAALPAEQRAASPADVPLDEAEQRQVTEASATLADVKRQLDGDDTTESLDARIAELETELGRADYAAKAPQQIRKPDQPAPTDVRSLGRMEARDAAMRVIEDSDDDLVTDENRSHLERLVSKRSKYFDGDQIARRLLITESDAYRTGWVKTLTAPAPVFTPEEARALNEFNELRAQSLTSDEGGYGVPVLIDPTIILTSGAADVPVLSVCRIEQITTKEWKGVSSAAPAWSTDGEATAVSDDAVTMAQPTVTTYNGRAFIPYSIEIGQDYPNFAAEMGALLEQGYLDYLAVKTMTGSGSDIIGIFTAIDATAGSEVVVTSDGVFQAADLDKVWKSLQKRFRRRSHWLMNVDVENEIRAFGSGTATSRFTVDQSEEGISRLNGRPVLIDDYAPEFTGTTGAGNILVVGDFMNYLFAQRAGMSVELVPHILDTTSGTPTGQRGWFAWARAGGDSINDNAFRLLQNQ